MLKYLLTACFVFTLFALLRHPVPILENIVVYSEPVTLQSFERDIDLKKDSTTPILQAKALPNNRVDHTIQPIWNRQTAQLSQ